MTAVAARRINKFLLLGDNQAAARRYTVTLKKSALHRAVRTARTNEVMCAVVTIHNIMPILLPDIYHPVGDEVFSHAVYEPLVELHTADGILVRRQGETQSLDLNIEPAEDCEVAGVGSRVELNIAQYARGDPTGTNLGAWKFSLIEQDEIHAVLLELPGAGCPSGTAAYNEHFCLVHSWSTKTANRLRAALAGEDHLP